MHIIRSLLCDYWIQEQHQDIFERQSIHLHIYTSTRYSLLFIPPLDILSLFSYISNHQLHSFYQYLPSAICYLLTYIYIIAPLVKSHST